MNEWNNAKHYCSHDSLNHCLLFLSSPENTVDKIKSELYLRGKERGLWSWIKRWWWLDYNPSSWEADLEKCSQGQPGQQNRTMSKKEKLIMISTLVSGLSGSWLHIMIWFHSQNFFKIDAIFGIELYYFSVWSNLEDLEVISPFNVTFPFRTTLGEVDFLAIAKNI